MIIRVETVNKPEKSIRMEEFGMSWPTLRLEISSVREMTQFTERKKFTVPRYAIKSVAGES